MEKEIRLRVNDKEYPVRVEPGDMLVDVLREKLGFTGTKKGCGTGDCGACTVILEGKPVNSCLVLAMAAKDKTIQTVEGLERNGELHSLQQSFIEHGAVQCGYGTPGMLMIAISILNQNRNPTEMDV
jgi:carbon-monoxide dehydrogenase small subunit